MTVTNMACFDQIPSRSLINLTTLVNDGHTVFDFSNPTLISPGIATNKGRQWLILNYTYLNQLGAATHSFSFWNKTIRALFDNPAVTTKAVIGFRLDLQAPGANILAMSGTNTMFLIDGVAVDNSFLTALPIGEHFIEFEMDLVNKVVRTVVNGGIVFEISRPAMTLDSLFRWGLVNTFVPSNVGIAFFITDLSMNYDNQDGTASGRLGPVRVYNTPADKLEIPANWKGLDDGLQTYNLKDGGTWDAAVIMPKNATESDQPGLFSFTSIPLMTSGTPWQCITPTTFRCYWAGGATTAIALNVTFADPKKVSGYVLQGYSNVSMFDGWKFQGSNDGAAWVDLDVRANGQAAWFMSQVDRIGAFKLAPDKIGSYRYYRLVVTNSVATSSRIELYHFNLLSDPADILENNVKPALSRPANSLINDFDYPVLRPAIDESEGSIGFKIPTFGTADVLAVKIGIAARRDQASSEHLVAKVKVGADSTTPVDYELKAHTEEVKPFALLQKTPGGAVWTKESLESLRVVVKTKRGAN